ncbi:MAG: CocE/NonD family hydrolase [Rhizobiaceae bacterium]|nr:CocE/NonD family hydrolase [Rhizobiaceae bacterium]
MHDSQITDTWPKITIEDGMRIMTDVPIAMADGVILRANVYLPIAEGRYPVIASLGAYGKDLPFSEAPYTAMWNKMVEKYPETVEGTTTKHTSFEVADPEHWIPHGYAVMRIDSRGAARSQGVMNTHSLQEAVDYAECIEWAAAQPWSNGKVGLSGISYFAVNQWNVATLKPKGLAALYIWEGASDWYREASHHGGIPCDFLGDWFIAQAESVQYGLGSRGKKNPYNGMQISGDIDLSQEELNANRVDVGTSLAARPFANDDYYRERSPDHSKIEVPMFSLGNWGGQGLHGRSNLLGFVNSRSAHKYLEVHGQEHWTTYYDKHYLALQRSFFDYYLKGQGNFPETQPKIILQIRHPGERFVPRIEQEWPLARTKWSRLYLYPAAHALEWTAPDNAQKAEYQGFGAGLTMRTAPLAEPMEITGPLQAKVFISSKTPDADLFLVLHVFDPDGTEVLFQGANEPKAPVAQGWLRASHRKLDPAKSRPWMPYHPHEVAEPLVPDEIYELDVEIWPTCIVIPAGYTIGFSVQGVDFDHGLPGLVSHYGKQMRGCAFFTHTGRPEGVYGKAVTVHSGPDHPSYVVLPIIPLVAP